LSFNKRGQAKCFGGGGVWRTQPHATRGERKKKKKTKKANKREGENSPQGKIDGNPTMPEQVKNAWGTGNIRGGGNKEPEKEKRVKAETDGPIEVKSQNTNRPFSTD